MRSSIKSTIQASKNVNKKTKEVLKLKDAERKAAKGKTEYAEDADEEWGGIGAEEEDPERPKKYGKEKEKAKPEEARDPFAKQPKKKSVAALEDDEKEAALPRGRTGKTEFSTASQTRSINDIVLAPPTLAKPARKGLLAKALSSASDGTDKKGILGGEMRIAGMEEPVGRSRLPIDPVMKALLDRERERAVKTYRELKEKKLAEKTSQ